MLISPYMTHCAPVTHCAPGYPSSEKKLVKPLKNCFFGTNLHKKGVIMGHSQNEKQFLFAEITKADHPAFRNFLFYQNICFD